MLILHNDGSTATSDPHPGRKKHATRFEDCSSTWDSSDMEYLKQCLNEEARTYYSAQLAMSQTGGQLVAENAWAALSLF